MKKYNHLLWDKGNYRYSSTSAVVMYKSVRRIQWKDEWKNLLGGRRLKRLYNSGNDVYGHRAKERRNFEGR